jgi:hypothetical protein
VTYNYSFGVYKAPDYFFHHIGRDLISDGFGGTVDTGHWQALTDVPHTQSVEMRNVLIEYPIPQDMGTLQTQLFPNLPWAEDHFQERVDPDPENLNPGCSTRTGHGTQVGSRTTRRAGNSVTHTWRGTGQSKQGLIDVPGRHSRRACCWRPLPLRRPERCGVSPGETPWYTASVSPRVVSGGYRSGAR